MSNTWYVWDLPKNINRKRECRTCLVSKDIDKFGKVNMFDTHKDGSKRYYIHIRLDCKECYARMTKEKRHKKLLQNGQDKLYKILMK